MFLSLFIPLPRNVHIEQLSWASDLFLRRAFFGGGRAVVGRGWRVGRRGRRWASWFVFHVTLTKQNATWLLLGYVIVSVPALSVMSVGTCTVQWDRDQLWARRTACMMVWGMSCQSTADFMFLLLKHPFPNWSSCSLHWSDFIMWSSARSFSRGNGVLHQKIHCHKKKAKLFPGAVSGILNSSFSLELNCPLDTYSKQMQTSIRTPGHYYMLRTLIPMLFPHFPEQFLLLYLNKAIRWSGAKSMEWY